MSRLLHRLRREDGFALAIVVLLTSVLVALSITLISLVTDESTRSVATLRGGTALQAAEAGLDDYLAKLVQDKSFFYRQVHPAESTRQGSSGGPVDPSDTCAIDTSGPTPTKTVTESGSPVAASGATWTGSISWTYPSGKDNWCQLPNGYEYNLQVRPPTAGDLNIKIVATGRRAGDTTNIGQWRALETWVHFSLVSDFQMIANEDITYGSAATTNGKIYAGRDSSGNNHSITHSGIATANLYAEASIFGSPTMQNGALKYTSATIRSQIPQPINFAMFQLALQDIQRAAQLTGNYYDASATSYRLVFAANGTYTIASCSGSNPASSAPSCGAASSAIAVPANGAIFVETTAIVSGQVNGRVTVAANGDVVVPADITYVQPGDDVLGLIGKNNVYMASWSPSTLSWRAGTIAQNGEWRSYSCSPTVKSTLNFTGSTATDDGGCASNFATRNYNYDPTLEYLPPPWFPALDDAYVVELFREVAP